MGNQAPYVLVSICEGEVTSVLGVFKTSEEAWDYKDAHLEDVGESAQVSELFSVTVEDNA